MAKGPSPLLGYNTNVRHKGRVYHIQTEDSGLAHPHVITHLFADGGRIVASRKTDYAQHVGDEGYAAIVKRLMQEQHKALFIALRDGVYDRDLEPSVASVPPPPWAATTASGNTRAPTAGAWPPSPSALHAAVTQEAAPRDTAPHGTRPLASAPHEATPHEAAAREAGMHAQRGGRDLEALERAAAAIGGAAPTARDLDALERAAAALGGTVPAPLVGGEPPVAAGRYQSTRPAVRAERVSPPPDDAHGAPAFGGDLLTERSLDEVILSYLAEDLEQEG